MFWLIAFRPAGNIGSCIWGIWSVSLNLTSRATHLGSSPFLATSRNTRARSGGQSLDEMAQSVGLSTAHFARMFRKSTGETPHQFVLRQRLERAKSMLRASDTRVLDVALACGFKTQQHFAQAFRDTCGVSPTRYRQDFLGYEATSALETRSEDTPRLVGVG